MFEKSQKYSTSETAGFFKFFGHRFARLFALRKYLQVSGTVAKIRLAEWKEKNLYGSFTQDFETPALDALYLIDNTSKVPNVDGDC